MHFRTHWGAVSHWLVMLVTGLSLLGADVLAETPAHAQGDSGCDHCACCIESSAPAPDATALPASPRSSLQNDFSVLTSFVLLLPAAITDAEASCPSPLFSCALAVPLYMRHCSFLL